MSSRFPGSTGQRTEANFGPQKAKQDSQVSTLRSERLTDFQEQLLGNVNGSVTFLFCQIYFDKN